jgi:hypothetical protein
VSTNPLWLWDSESDVPSLTRGATLFRVAQLSFARLWFRVAQFAVGPIMVPGCPIMVAGGAIMVPGAPLRFRVARLWFRVPNDGLGWPNYQFGLVPVAPRVSKGTKENLRTGEHSEEDAHRPATELLSRIKVA